MFIDFSIAIRNVKLPVNFDLTITYNKLINY